MKTVLQLLYLQVAVVGFLHHAWLWLVHLQLLSHFLKRVLSAGPEVVAAGSLRDCSQVHLPSQSCIQLPFFVFTNGLLNPLGVVSIGLRQVLCGGPAVFALLRISGRCIDP